MEDAYNTTPLAVKVLHKSQDDDSATSDDYEVLQSVVSPSPIPGQEEAEIRTVVERFVDNNHRVLWRRVVVRSGPSCPKQAVHASYMLPDDGKHFASVSMVCWTSFPERPHHKMLCVLASPTLLRIWDVYPDGKVAGIGAEGHSIPLPFEACGIYSLGGSNGLLLQRTETMEDRIAFDAQNKTWTSTGLNVDDDEDGFVLKAPPRPVRLRDSIGTSVGSLNLASSNSVPSLFSLSHPLDDVLPIYNLIEGDLQPGAVSDVFEKIIYVGVLKWTDPDADYAERVTRTQPICVTYHTHRKRHAIWEIKKSPPPPPPVPLWQMSNHRRSHNSWNNHLGILQQDLEDIELFGGVDPEFSQYNINTRNEALADALGVRKTPRKTVEDAAPRARNIASRSNRNRNRGTSNVSLLSPLSRPFNETQMDIDASVGSAFRAPVFSMGPFASLHPKVAMTCLFEEPEMSPQAQTVFMASNFAGFGELVVCLVCENGNPMSSNSMELRTFSFVPTLDNEKLNKTTESSGGMREGIGKLFTVSPGYRIPCLAAQPIQASPIPACYHPRDAQHLYSLQRLATDILILRVNESGERGLSLYREQLHIIDSALYDAASGDEMDVLDIQNGVRDRVDLICSVKDALGSECVRGILSLQTGSMGLGERVLQAVDAGLVAYLDGNNPVVGTELCLKIRADCVRLERAISEQAKKDGSLFEDPSSIAVRTVLTALFRKMLGVETANTSASGKTEPSADSAWSLLLKSDFHERYSAGNSGQSLFGNFGQQMHDETTSDSTWINDRCKLEMLAHLVPISVGSVDPAEFGKTSCWLFDSLHALYEDFKLFCTLRDTGIRYVGSILSYVCSICSSAGDVSNNAGALFLAHYKKDFGREEGLQQGSTANFLPTMVTSDFPSKNKFPPCILSFLDGLISGNISDSGLMYRDGSSLNAACRRTRSIIRVFLRLYARNDIAPSDDVERNDYDVVRGLIEEGFTDRNQLRDELPIGVALPLLEVLHRCRGNPNIPSLSKKDAQMWLLIGREDLYQNVKDGSVGSSSSRDVAEKDGAGQAQSPDVGSVPIQDDRDQDGIQALEKSSAMLFPSDNRVREVGKLLRSSRAVYLNVPRAIEVSDHDYERMKQEKLLLLSRRVLALPVGRGMLTIGSLQPVPAEPLPVPDLCLVGRVPPTNAMLALDTADCPSDMKMWPEFHNGVAAGLRLPLEKEYGESVSKITRTWIVYNRPQGRPQSQGNSNSNNSESPNIGNGHGGLLMALGMRGHLTTLEMTDIFDYLTQGTVTTTVGVLLGMSANMRGTCDISVSKMLCLHIPSLIPQHFSAIDVASPVQAAAVAGAGLLYQGSSHRMMTEFLLNEIGKRPSNDVNVFDREAYTLSCGIALGMVNLCMGSRHGNDTEGGGNAGLADLRIEDRLYRYIVGGLDDAELRRRREETDRLSLPSASSSNNNEKCSCVFEGESINTDVTAPGATLALGLIYMKSGNRTIASAIALPDTHFLLEYVRSDFLMLRVVARALILWDDVQPTKEWIESQLPVAVQTAYGQMRDLAESLSHPTGRQPSGNSDKAFDRQAVRLIYTHVIAGACFSLGLRYAGTGNRDAAAAIFERAMYLRELRDGNDPVSSALRPVAPVLEMCLSCVAVSLSMVLAGTGDLEALRLLKVLRWRCDEEVNYGSHMAYGVAIGLLFVGAGTCTIGRDPEDIAALLMAFYPRYPSTTSDNQYHLQALRHLYALAVKHRVLCAVDVDTRENIVVPIQINFEDTATPPLRLSTPCLLSNHDTNPKELAVISERYYPVSLALSSRTGRITFFVKRRSAHLSYEKDPFSQRSLLVQTGGIQGGHSLDLIASFTNDERVLAFAKHICGVGMELNNLPYEQHFSVSVFFSRVLNECLLLDTDEALPMYLALHNAAASGPVCCIPVVWDFRLVLAYYRHRQRLVPDDTPRLLNCELMTFLNEMFESALCQRSNEDENGKNRANNALAVYYDLPILTTVADN